MRRLVANGGFGILAVLVVSPVVWASNVGGNIAEIASVQVETDPVRVSGKVASGERRLAVTLTPDGDVLIPAAAVASAPARDPVIQVARYDTSASSSAGERMTLSAAPVDTSITRTGKDPVYDWSRDAGTRSNFVVERWNRLHQVEVGFEIEDYKYEEPGLMEDTGVLVGVLANYAMRWHENAVVDSWSDIVGPNNLPNLLRFESRFSYGETDYTSNGTGSSEDIPRFAFEFRALLGQDIPLRNAWRVTPFAGIGYWYLFDDSGGLVTTTGHLGYDRESRYVYFPLGMDIEKAVSDRWSVRFSAEYDFLIDGEQTSHLEDVGTGLDALDNDQNEGYGARASLRVTRFGDRYDVFVEPFFRYWHIEDSLIEPITSGGQPIAVPGSPGYVYAGLEPENKTTEWGVKAGFAF